MGFGIADLGFVGKYKYISRCRIEERPAEISEVKETYFNRLKLVLLIPVVLFFLSVDLPAQCAPTSVGTPLGVKMLEIGKISRASFQRRWRTVWRSVPTDDIYIVNYGSDTEIVRREKWITDLMGEFESPRARVIVVRGRRTDGPRSVFWKVPPGADYPKP